MSEEKKNPAPPEILKERDRLISRVGGTEIIQTKDSITLRAKCKNRPDFGSKDDLSKR